MYSCIYCKKRKKLTLVQSCPSQWRNGVQCKQPGLLGIPSCCLKAERLWLSSLPLDLSWRLRSVRVTFLWGPPYCQVWNRNHGALDRSLKTTLHKGMALFWDRVSLVSPGWSGPQREPPASISGTKSASVCHHQLRQEWALVTVLELRERLGSEIHFCLFVCFLF